MTPKRRLKVRYPSPGKPKQDDHRTARQLEDYYRRRGYAKENIEQLAEDDLQLTKALQGRRRTKKPLNLTGMSN